MKKRAILADIARAANVSLMTASRAINQKPGVSEDVRQRILALAAEMGYRPNAIARSLATRQTTTIGLVVPDITNPFFAQVARGVEDAAFENQYSVFLLNTNEDRQRESAALDSLWQKDIDGIILCSSRLTEAELTAQIQRFPALVLINREVKNPPANLVTINVDDRQIARLAVEHFLADGRRQIGCIGGPAASFSSRRRLAGYRRALKEAGLPVDSSLVENALPNTEGGRQATAALLARQPALDAIFAFNDLIAVGAMQACQETGRRVPEDIAIIGVDDIPLAEIIRPRLTTLHLNLAHMGRLGVHTLLQIIAGEPSQPAHRIEPHLMVRESA